MVRLLTFFVDPKAKFQLSTNLERFLSACAALSESTTLNEIVRRDHSLFNSQTIQEQVRACFRHDDAFTGTKDVGRPTKSCPFGSLLSNLVICMMQQNPHEPYRIAQLFFAFVGELRQRWDEGCPSCSIAP